jgi:hypothetical protein
MILNIHFHIFVLKNMDTCRNFEHSLRQNLAICIKKHGHVSLKKVIDLFACWNQVGGNSEHSLRQDSAFIYIYGI